MLETRHVKELRERTVNAPPARLTSDEVAAMLRIQAMAKKVADECSCYSESGKKIICQPHRSLSDAVRRYSNRTTEITYFRSH